MVVFIIIRIIIKKGWAHKKNHVKKRRLIVIYKLVIRDKMC